MSGTVFERLEATINAIRFGLDRAGMPEHLPGPEDITNLRQCAERAAGDLEILKTSAIRTFGEQEIGKLLAEVQRLGVELSQSREQVDELRRSNDALARKVADSPAVAPTLNASLESIAKSLEVIVNGDDHWNSLLGSATGICAGMQR